MSDLSKDCASAEAGGRSPAPEANTSSRTKKAAWSTAATTILLAAFIKSCGRPDKEKNEWLQYLKPSTQQTESKRHPPIQLSSGAATSAYWKATVLELRNNFRSLSDESLVPEQGRPVPLDRAVTTIRRAQTSLTRMAVLPGHLVDNELKSAVSRQTRTQVQVFQLFDDIFVAIRKNGRTELSAQDLATGFAWLNGQTLAEPANGQAQVLSRLLELLEALEDDLSEQDRLQGKLSERYSGHSFPLPPLK